MRLAYKWQAALVVALGLFMAVLDNTIVSVALPQMQAYFHTDRETINWVATAYFLAQAAIIPVTGYVSDRIGTKTVFLTALAFFTLGSGLCAIAPNEHLLIAFRVLQGIGGGALFPTAFAITFRVFPPAERGPAGAVIGVPVLLAPAFGPTVGGYLTTTFDWHANFTVNLPIGVIAFLLGYTILRGRASDSAQTGEPAPDRGRFDVLGLLLAMAGFTALVYGITEAGSSSWTDQKVLIALIGGGVLLLAFVVTELRVSDPVMDLRLFLNYTFTVSNVLMWAISGFLFAGLFLLPIFFQQIQGYTPLQSGEFVILQGLAAAVGTVLSGRFYNVIGPRILATIGFILVTAGTIGFTRLSTDTTWQSLQVWMVLRGLGLGFTNIPLQTLSLSIVSNRQMARASSLVNVMRQVASAIGLTVLTTYFVTQTTAHVGSAKTAFTGGLSQGGQFDPSKLTPAALQHLAQQKSPLGAAVQHCMQQFAGHTQAIGSCIQQQGQQYVFAHAATSGLNDAFVVALVGCAIAAVLALFVGRDPNIAAAKQAAARGEVVQARPAMIGE
jgi:EmrB/QacA subfamily drug resistance transporter